MAGSRTRQKLQARDDAGAGARMPTMLVALLLILTLLIGGGGRPAFIAETTAIIVSFIIAGIWLIAVRDRECTADRTMTVLGACFIALPILHLIPMPQFILGLRPLEATIAGSLSVVGQGDGFRAITIDRGRTIAALLSMLPPFILWLMLRTFPVRDRLAFGGVILLAVLVSALLAAVQVASGGAIGHIYKTHFGFASGVMANRNSAADFYVIAICILVVGYTHIKARRSHAKIALPFIGIGLLLVVATILTGSRSGTVLLVIPAALALFLNRSRLTQRQFLMIAGGTAALIILVLLLASQVPMIERTISRFSLGGDGRYSLWEDARFAISQAMPLGSGMGTGDIMMKWAENLDSLDPPYPNRVHNDYFEFVLEAGIYAGLLLAAIVVTIAVRTARLFSSGDHDERMAAILGPAILAVIALHSVVDYPLRSITISMVAAFALSLLSNSQHAGPRKAQRSKAPA